MKNKKRIDNNGFSLVELIIVIAIMVVLVGVLAPQYLKYVERGRESADLSNIDIMVSAVEIYNADPNNQPVSGTITATNGAVVVADAIKPALQDAGITTSPANMKSTKYATWTITFSSTSVQVSGNADLPAALGRTATSTPTP
ncbi:MAG: prepilin-type N-terminal cleavage/methylation domain-containing protein [Acetatifactor sp.]|nr:prepilin-type N-terminal cleavage/methylation domain-containing protein [Acetatifactor sp.]